MRRHKSKSRDAHGDLSSYYAPRKATRFGDGSDSSRVRPTRDVSNDCAAGDRWNIVVLKPRPPFADIMNTGTYKPVKRFRRFGLK